MPAIQPPPAPGAPPYRPHPAAYAPMPMQTNAGASRVVDDPRGLARHVTRVRSLPVLKSSVAPLRTKKRLRLEAGVVPVLDACEHIFAGDKSSERWKTILLIVGIVCLVGGMFSLWIHPALLVLVVLGGLVFLVRYFIASGDIEDRKLDVVAGVLTAFGGELKSGRPVKVMADFSYHDQRPPVGAHSSGVPFFGSSTKERAYAHDWLEMQFVLADGCTVIVEGKTLAKTKTRSKRKYNKIKEAIVERLRIRIAAPRGRSFSPRLAQRSWGRPQFSGLALRRGVVRPNYALFEYETGQAMRMRLRNGWSGRGIEGLLDGQKVTSAIIATYKTAASAEREVGA